MGCAVSGVRKATMSLINKNSNDARSRLERKLYFARESPEPDFDLSDCELRLLPSGIFSICKVYRKDNLYLQKNYLQSLDHGGQLSDLHLIKVLNISFNRFSQLSNDVRYLVNLTELYINDNLLKNIPDNIKYMECLKVLDVSNNKLKAITPSLGNLKCLSRINLTCNEYLNKLCPELCLARNLSHIELDGAQFIFPPSDITCDGTEAIMRYLCQHQKIDYVNPLDIDVDMSPVSEIQKRHDQFLKGNTTTWEEQEAAIVEKERLIHKANQLQRDKFLSEIIQEQSNLDTEIAKLHKGKEADRQKLIKEIQKDEIETDNIVKNFIQSDRLNPEIVQQQLAYEKSEHNKLLEITRQNYDNIKKSEVLKAMESQITNEYFVQNFIKNYKDNLNNVKENVLTQESESNSKLSKFLNAKDSSRTILIQQLLDDEDLQKAMVTSLLEKVDSKTWSLNEEIAFISSHLVKLSMIEQEKKKMQIAYNYNELLNQRMQLVNLLDDLFCQRNKRRKQLIETINEVEMENSNTTDFWLKNYQKLIDSAPKNFLNVSKHLDPILANYLLQEEVIHCLPFLVKFLFSGESLANITAEKLKENGVSLSSDRNGILNAIKYYIDLKMGNNIQAASHSVVESEPIAPSMENSDEQACSGFVKAVEEPQNLLEGECVICMDEKSEVVFVPCGHMCCCQNCGTSSVDICPMCRASIERKIKIIIS